MVPARTGRRSGSFVPRRTARWSRILLLGCLPAAFAWSTAVQALECRSDGRARGQEPRALVLLAEGDSITSGEGATDGKGSYVARATIAGFAAVDVTNQARTQATLGTPNDVAGDNSLWGRYGLAKALAAHKRNDTEYAVSILIGRNDLVNYGSPGRYLDHLVGYAQALKEAGWDEVAVGTLLPSDWPPFSSLSPGFNDALRSMCARYHTAIDRVIDFADLPEMSRDAAARNRALFADGTHPTNLGYDLMARTYADTLAGR